MLQRERYELLKVSGVSFTDWCNMTRWQRQDIHARHIVERHQRAKKAKDGKLAGLIGVLAEKLLGF